MKAGDVGKLRVVRAVVSVLLLGTAGGVGAAEIRWADPVDGYWNVASNWDPAQVPGTNDVAVITNAGVYTVTLNINPDIAGLTIGGTSGTQTVAFAGRILSVRDDAVIGSHGSIYFNGGQLAGGGTYELHGSMEWISGDLKSNSVLQVAADGRCDISSIAKYTKSVSGTLVNGGYVHWGPNGSLVVDGTLINETNGLFEVSNDNSSLPTYRGTGLFVNHGTFRKIGGVGNINCYMPFVNGGTLDIQSGALTLLAGRSFEPGCVFTGSGITILSGGTYAMAGDLYSDNLHLQYSATLTGTGTVHGAMQWGGGTIGSNAFVTIATNGYLLVASDFQHGKILSGKLVNEGVVEFRSLGNLSVSKTLENRPGGVLEFSTDNVGVVSAEAGAGILNSGQLLRTGGTIGNVFYIPVTNSGAVRIDVGKLKFTEGFWNPGGRIELRGGNFESDEPLDVQGGVLSGRGTVYASVLNSGTVRPSRTNGILTVSGNYAQQTDGVAVFEIGETCRASTRRNCR